MRNIIIGIVAAIVLGVSSCAQRATGTRSDANRYMCGAYTGYRALTDEDVRIFDATYNNELKLKPQSVATQVVAGLNYRFICTDESGNDIKVVIFKPLPNQGEARVVSVETVTPSAETKRHKR